MAWDVLAVFISPFTLHAYLHRRVLWYLFGEPGLLTNCSMPLIWFLSLVSFFLFFGIWDWSMVCDTWIFGERGLVDMLVFTSFSPQFHLFMFF